MQKSKHLTAADRRVIEILLKRNCTYFEIAKELSVDKSTVCREINNRSTPTGYFAIIAQTSYETNRRKSRKRKKLSSLKSSNYVLDKIMSGWSPQQIAGRMKFENRSDCVCMETIYNWVYTDNYCKSEKLFQYLRQGKKRRTKHNSRKTKSQKILNKISIHDRSPIVPQHIEFGHFEGDSVIYPNFKAINSVNELMTGLVHFNFLNRKTAGLTYTAVVNTLSKYNALTYTVDNGSEHAQHELISQQTGVTVYFCDPYCSNQRGSNENCNGLLRRYLPRGKSIDNLTQEDLDDIAWELNNRPRKRLGYLTPIEFYEKKVLNLRKDELVAFESRI